MMNYKVIDLNSRKMFSRTYYHILILFFTGFFISGCFNQSTQIADENFEVTIESPAYQHGEGPVILIDEGHNNFHKADGRFLTFAKILRQDGYQIESLNDEFTLENLSDARILVIANALHESNVDSWSLPTPSAFSKKEINALRLWVESGGRLFLIADHMPWPGASSDLAAEFGFKFYNGFNVEVRSPSYFLRSNGTLVNNVITNGRGENEYVKRIPITEGQAFEIPDDAIPILKFNNSSLMLMPDTAWKFHQKTPLVPIKGFMQGAYKEVGNGRIVVMGEASMFTAQINTKLDVKMGMNRKDAPDNSKLLLNIIHWLDGLIEDSDEEVAQIRP